MLPTGYWLLTTSLHSSFILHHSSFLWNRRALVEPRFAGGGVEQVREVQGVERRAGRVKFESVRAERRGDFAPGGGAALEARPEVRERAAEPVALVERVELREPLEGERPDLLVAGSLVHAPVHLAREIAAAALRLHLRCHRVHPRGRAGQTRARRVSLARLREGSGLPVDVTEVLVEPPVARVVADAFLHETDGRVAVNRGEDDRAELVGGHELWVEGGRLVEQRAEVAYAERSHVVEREVAAVGVNLATDVLERAQPVPVGHQPVEAEAQAARRLRPDVEFLVRREGVFLGTARVEPAREREDRGQPRDDDEREQRVVPQRAARCFHIRVHLKLRRLKMRAEAASSTAM